MNNSPQSVRITAKVKLLGGKFVSERNIPFLRLRSTRLCRGHVGHPGIKLKKDGYEAESYFEMWVICHEPRKGFCWREITHGCGVCGHQPTVRALVLATASFLESGRMVLTYDEAAGPMPEFVRDRAFRSSKNRAGKNVNA